MLHLLEPAQLIRNLRSDVEGISLMNKPDKIFLNNTSLISALAEQQPDKGNLRDTFFLSQYLAGYLLHLLKYNSNACLSVVWTVLNLPDTSQLLHTPDMISLRLNESTDALV